MLYTMEWEPSEKSFYVILYVALRSNIRPNLQPWFLYLRLVINAVQKLPTFNRTVYRDVKAGLSNQYILGNTVIWWSFLHVQCQ